MKYIVNFFTLSSAVTLFLTASIVNAQNTTTSSNATTTTGGVPEQVSPRWLSTIKPIAGNVQSYPSGGKDTIPTGPLATINFTITSYPEGWKSPPTDSIEVQAAIKAIDWTKVPNSSVRKADSNGDLSMTGYDSAADPDCWWSATGCVKSNNPLIPADAAACPKVGDWGLTYDDGPLTADAGTWAEPHLYDFLAAHNQKAGLFYIGSNVIAAPAAAQRALADGHTLCVHTWSHPAMTSLANDNVVAELYWTLKAIKEVTGVTTKCWRPPYGDVDDRVRAIAWQMGLTTVLWDEDTNDWNMPGDGGGNLSPSTVDGYFENWIASRSNGTDNKSGHIVLQHELNNATVSMAEKWLPEVQKVFNVVPWNQCFDVSLPYWETNFVYPISDGSIPAAISSAPISSIAPTAAVSGGAQTSEPSAVTAAGSANSAGSSKKIHITKSIIVLSMIAAIACSI